MKLSAESQKIYDNILKVYSIRDEAGKLLLLTLCESLDLARDCQKEIDKHGLVIKDKYSRIKQNPACMTLKDARTTMLACMRQLNLDFDIDTEIKKFK